MKLRRLRDGDVLDDGDIVLVRGGELDLEILRADAARYYSLYGVYGISVFAVRDGLSAACIRQCRTPTTTRNLDSGGALMESRIDLGSRSQR